VPLVVLLTVAGDHVPTIPFNEVVGNTGAVVSAQKAGIALNVGVTNGLTVIEIVVIVPHCPAFGVKVYVPLVVLLTFAGNHVPTIPFNEVVGSTGAVVPVQKAGIVLNVGVGFVKGDTTATLLLDSQPVLSLIFKR
jgi:ribosomal protein L21E